MPRAPLPSEVAAEWMPSANDPDQVEHDLPVRPEAWRGWRVAIEPLFFFTEHSSSSTWFYEHYRAQTFDEAVGKLFDERGRAFAHQSHPDHVGYRCYAIGVIPAFRCTVEWPLLRRGGQSGIAAYEPRDRIVPSIPQDTTLFVVWRRPNGAFGFTFTYMLSVNGRSQCATPLRTGRR